MTLYYEDSSSGTKIFLDEDTAKLVPVVEDTQRSIGALKQKKDQIWSEYLLSDDEGKDSLLIEIDILDECIKCLS